GHQGTITMPVFKLLFCQSPVRLLKVADADAGKDIKKEKKMRKISMKKIGIQIETYICYLIAEYDCN
ncbi:hypothetical protein LOAG_09147, partial [Loa loa]